MFVTKARPQDAALSCRPADSAKGPRSSANFGNTRKNAPFIFSSLRTLFPTPNPQTSHLHPLADSFKYSKDVTPAFPVTSALFPRSFAQERKSTPLLSSACARFCRYVGVCAKP